MITMQDKLTTPARKFQQRRELFFSSRAAAHARHKAAAKKLEQKIHIFNHTPDDDTLEAILNFSILKNGKE